MWQSHRVSGTVWSLPECPRHCRRCWACRSKHKSLRSLAFLTSAHPKAAERWHPLWAQKTVALTHFNVHMPFSWPRRILPPNNCWNLRHRQLSNKKKSMPEPSRLIDFHFTKMQIQGLLWHSILSCCPYFITSSSLGCPLQLPGNVSLKSSRRRLKCSSPFWAPGFSVAHPCPLQDFGKWTS